MPHPGESYFNKLLVLALFPECLARPQPDWPQATVQTGFVHFDRAESGSGTLSKLNAFLCAGEPPIVFTQGSTAVHNAGRFFRESVNAARQLRRRALLLGGAAEQFDSVPNVLALPYVPYSAVFPHAAAIVHQGGSGTLGQGLRAGRPMLVVPYGWDQPDNGARMERLGVGLTLARRRYSGGTAARSLGRLLTEPRFAQRAHETAAELREEDGLLTALRAIERLLTD